MKKPVAYFLRYFYDGIRMFYHGFGYGNNVYTVYEWKRIV